MANVLRVGCTRACPFGVRFGPVPRDDLHAGVRAQPVRQHHGGAVVEKVDRAMRLQVNEQRGVPVPAAQREVIDLQHAWRRDDGVTLSQQPEQRVRARRRSCGVRESRPRLAASGLREGGEHRCDLRRAPRVAWQAGAKRLRKCVSVAARIRAAEPPDAQP